MTPAPLRRRTVLVGGGTLVALGGAGALGGCTGEDGPAPPAPPDPDAEPLLRARAAEDRLLALYDAAIAQQPALADRLEPFRAEHAGHLEALSAGSSPTPSLTAPTATSPAAPAAASSAAPTPAPGAPTAPALPATPAAVLRLLAQEESAAADARVDGLVTASAPVRRLLASIGASEAAHAALLRRRDA
ncbi:hypothetical protein [Motilibacter deserti]|uniref:Ferritin-like domain-containing protein n=1 Tax=Motilibacter deserti TaxID=2714956 RepID=A0ABX0GRU1_9ACTN|nr:hypothetical protein [Motilibacter deserti]